jgi:hypothetical protein
MFEDILRGNNDSVETESKKDSNIKNINEKLNELKAKRKKGQSDQGLVDEINRLLDGAFNGK